jgi:tetratricopeptide (TPR) repeat protein
MLHLSRSIANLLVASALCLSACKGEPPEAKEARLHLDKGEALFLQRDFAAAAVELEQALKLSPRLDLKVWEKAAFCYMKAGNTEKAAELLVKTIELKPDDATYKLERYRDLSSMYLQAQVLDKAEQWFLEVMKLDPKDDQSLAWLGEIAAIRGGARAAKAPVHPDRLDVALARYDQLIALTPAAPAPYINKRIVLTRYLGYLGEQVANAPDRAKMQARIDELKAAFSENNRKLGEVQKAARASR